MFYYRYAMVHLYSIGVILMQLYASPDILKHYPARMFLACQNISIVLGKI